MKNWSTDEALFKSKQAKKFWELEQKLNFGIGTGKLSKKEIVDNWDNLKDKISPYTKRLLEFLIWGKQYSLPPISSSGIGRQDQVKILEKDILK